MIPAALAFYAHKKLTRGDQGPSRAQYNTAITQNNRIKRLIAENNAKLMAASKNAVK